MAQIILKPSFDDPTVCWGLGESMLWSFHPKFALGVKTCWPHTIPERVWKSWLLMQCRLLGGIQQAQADLQMAWERGKETGLAFIMIREWGWGEGSHLWARLTWFQFPVSTKGRSTKAFLSTSPNLGRKAGAWKFLNVKHQKWNQSLYCNSCLMFDWWWIYAMFHLIKFILFKYAIVVL